MSEPRSGFVLICAYSPLKERFWLDERPLKSVTSLFSMAGRRSIPTASTITPYQACRHSFPNDMHSILTQKMYCLRCSCISTEARKSVETDTNGLRIRRNRAALCRHRNRSNFSHVMSTETFWSPSVQTVSLRLAQRRPIAICGTKRKRTFAGNLPRCGLRHHSPDRYPHDPEGHRRF